MFKSKYNKKTNELAQAILTEQDTVKRWRMTHDLLRLQNKKAAKEQDKQAKAMANVREKKLYNQGKGGSMGLKFGVSIPNMTWEAIVQADILTTGKSVLRGMDKTEYQDIKSSNQIVRDLAEAFPEYKAS